MPGDYYVKMAPKWGKATDHDPNVISFKGGQDTSACQILGNSSHVFWRKSWKPQKWGISTDHDQNLIVLKAIRIHHHAKFETIPPLCSQENAQKSQIWPVSLSLNAAKMRKINRWWPKSNQFSRWSGYISNFRPFKVTAIKAQVRDQHLWCHHKH